MTLSCRVLGFSKQAFYKCQANPVSDRDWADAHLINMALDIHNDDQAFGYRFIADQLAEHGIAVSEKTGSNVCANRNRSGRCSPRSEGSHVEPAHRCMTTWSTATSPHRQRTWWG